jgi:hypothetical protein
MPLPPAPAFPACVKEATHFPNKGLTLVAVIIYLLGRNC